MTTVSLTLNEKEIQQLDSFFHEYSIEPGPYMTHQYSLADCRISVYASGKAVFQGKSAEIYAERFRPKDALPQAGSDEVGTGDFFGPVCVCAVLLQKDSPLIHALRDSKKVPDERIRELGPELLSLPHSLLILSPEKYNEVSSSNNMNRIKARLHNQCYVNLEKKYGKLPGLKVIDQFTPEDMYYRYLHEEKKVIRGITFRTKAEDTYPSVGAASMIARYAFLKEFDKLDEQYHVHFPKGAGRNADAFAKKFLRQYGEGEMEKVAKMNFTNVEKIK